MNPVCDATPGCARVARYVTSEGEMSCALCAIDRVAVRYIDIPVLLRTVVDMLDELDRQKTSAAFGARQDVRGIIGRGHK